MIKSRDLVSVCSAAFGLCAIASLLLLLDLKGLQHCGTNLLLQTVVIVGKVLALDLWRSLSSGRHQLHHCRLERGRFPVSGGLRRVTMDVWLDVRVGETRQGLLRRPDRGHCPSLRTRVSRRFGPTWRAGARILRFCLRRDVPLRDAASSTTPRAKSSNPPALSSRAPQ